jgi:hypothetical protein
MDALLHVFRALEPHPLRSAPPPRADDPQQLADLRESAEKGLCADRRTVAVGDSLEPA